MAKLDIICLKGITIGGIVDVLGSAAMSIPVAIVAAWRIALPSLPAGEQARALGDALESPPYYFATLLLGSLFSVIGGYVCARIARRGEVLNGALSALPCIFLGVWGSISGMIRLPLWQHLLFILLTLALGALGGYLQLRRAQALAGRAA